MKVVLVGDINRESPQDCVLVNLIIDAIKVKYPKLRIITKGCDRGVGKFIKARLTDQERQPKEIDWMEVSLRHHQVEDDLPKMEYTSDYDALNSVLLELGDEFHILSTARPQGVIMNLLRRVLQANRPYSLYRPEDKIYKDAEFPPMGGVI